MVPGMNGLPGVRALLLAPMGQCSAHVSAMAHHMEAQSAEETGVRLATASSKTAQVCPCLPLTFVVAVLFND